MRTLSRLTWFAAAVLFAIAGAGAVREPEAKFAVGAPVRPAPIRPAGVPKGFDVPVGCVPAMGVHWISPKAFPFGPLYGSYRGRLVFVEYMIAQVNFVEGKSWTDLKVLPGAKVDHVDTEFLPKGHEGYEIPHYDVHIYFVPHAEHLKYRPPC